LTIDPKGRVTPRKMKKDAKEKKKQQSQQSQRNKVAVKKEILSTMESFAALLKFRTKTPKIIDLTANDNELNENGGRLPSTLVENAIHCKSE
jgi:hypothetical protein